MTASAGGSSRKASGDSGFDRMIVLDGIEAVAPPLWGCVLTVGNFDGVHRAHQQLLAQSGMFAAHTGGRVVVLTFEPHPLTVVAPQKAPPRLSTRQQKIDLLAHYGADVVAVARSEPSLLGLEAEAFVQQVIVDRFHPTHVVEGASFGFGRGRRGTTDLLAAAGHEAGFQVHVVDPVRLEIEPGEAVMVSSSLVRSFLSVGKVRRAGLCLGRPYAVGGRVIHGRHRGRSLGFPTANVEVAGQMVPADGVYAGRAKVGDLLRPCAVSIGTAPTFGESGERVETHLIDFDGDLYDAEISVEFLDRLRDNRPFSGPQALTEQLKVDVARARQLAEERD
ncbi:MAG: bifunctional riboflavin kinase/FAD synthetase [Phycisphaerales bacterium]|nr:MAG: bifunctional riboflavin kinase/FAD synthetase [Phycisphaerales bacterium]